MSERSADIVNVAQAEAWNGAQSVGWLEREEQHASAARAHREAVLAAAAVGAGETVLDVGCGTGATTLAVARAVGPEGSAVGLDISGPMLARAREHAQAEGLGNVEFLEADAQVEPLGAARFDVVLSKFGVMFFDDPVAAFANFAAATRPDGRLAFVSWRRYVENPWLQVLRGAVAGGRQLPAPPEDVAGMLGLASAGHIESVLAQAGWRDVALEALDLPFALGPLDEACAFAASVGVVSAALQDADDDTRAAALASLREVLAAYEGPDGVDLPSGVWIVTARSGGAGR
ncbi:MAG: class I SAM-dependent methyltransferase [Acidimicrobiia bacterium]